MDVVATDKPIENNCSLSTNDNLSSKHSQEYIIDPLVFHLNPDNHCNACFNVQEAIEALKTVGYYHVPAVLTEEECKKSIDRIWDFIEDTSGGVVRRSNPKTWYPPCTDVDSAEQHTTHVSKENDLDPWPHTGYSSFPDMFQSLGAGFVLGNMRELLAERIFEPLYGTRELLCSKEGFTFHRPLVVDVNDEQLVWNPYAKCSSSDIMDESTKKMRPIFKVCGRPQPMSEGQHFDQGVPLSVMNHLNGKENAHPSTNKQHNNEYNKHQSIQDLTGLCHIQASVSFTNQSADRDNGGGHFLCYPHSHSLHHTLVGGTYRATSTEGGDDRSWVPLTDVEIEKLSDLGCREKRIYANVGDVILWRSDLVVSMIG